MLSIIIPSQSDKYLKLLLHSLQFSQPDHKRKCKIFIADDGISDGFKRLHPTVEFVRCEKPFCFARNVNVATAEALRMNPDGHLLIQNDDTYIKSKRFVDELEALIPRMLEERWAIISPRIMRNCGNIELTKRTRGNDLKRISDETIPFISVLITAQAWSELGPLDERFVGYGWEDVAFCFKAHAAGYRLGWTSGIQVDHEGSATYKQYGEQLDVMSREAREAFFKHYPHPLSKAGSR